MIVPVFLLFIWCASGEYKCSNGTDTLMQFQPSVDQVVGRYTAELCTLWNPNVTQWKVDLTYYDTPQYCNESNHRHPIRPGHEHSSNSILIEDNSNCTQICYSMNFDLIFSSCYGVKSTLYIGDIDLAPYDAFPMVMNNFTIDHFLQTKPEVNIVNHDNEVTLIWYLGLPPTEYKISLSSNDTDDQVTGISYLDLSGNCTRYELRNELHCSLSPAYGCYVMRLKHEAPWVVGVFTALQNMNYEFCHKAAAATHVVVETGRARVWWACGAALVAAAALAGAAVARRARARAAYCAGVRDGWLDARMTEEQAAAAADAERGVQQLGARPVLLLYAREGERAQRAVDALAALLHRTTGDHVYDIWSARVAALAGRAPHAWVRAAVGAPHVRVLLLQTPALAALYRDQLSQQPGDALRLAEPLLGRRVAYRVPQFGATLLHYALRLVLLAPHDHHAYRKYFLATYKGLSADIMPQVVPFKRYSLPHTVPSLLADLAPREQGPGAPREQGPPPDPQLLDAFHQHAEQFVQHARDDPNYLMDELFVIQN